MTRLTLCALSLSVLLGACAEQRPAIDRVQPNAIEKTFFVGADLVDVSDNPEFWTQGTLIDVGYGAAQSGLFTSTYAQPMSRIRWQITEDLLIGRLAYERVEGSDGKGVGNKTQEGVIVVAYPIEKHFDIVQAYNPTTGEQLNLLEENSLDRPWYERTHIRVDWSKNLNVDSYDFDTLSLLGIYGSVEYESLAYDVTDPSSPDAPFFDESGDYFDITSKAFAKPLEIDLSHLGWGIDAFPACFMDADFMGGSFPSGSCSPVELTIRQSFRKVEDTDYEPKDWDGYRFQSYGAFTVERMGYSRNYGMSDTLWRRFITRYDIWERSHYYEDPAAMTGPVECYTPETTAHGADPRADEDGNGTHDECEAAGAGSQCDIFRQRCTLPYGERTPITIPWYYTEGSNADFFEPTDWATHDWDIALRVAVRTGQLAECQATGQEGCAARFPVYSGQQTDNVDAVMLGREVDACRNGDAYAGQDCGDLADSLGAKRGYSDGVIAISKMEEMIVLCHSPVAEDDHAACGAAGTTARRGDLRYHQVNVISEPQTPSPWGIYTDAEDPLTGQTVSASINVWSHVNDLWSQKVVDMLRYIAGELTTSDVTEGENVRAWAQAAEAASMGGAAPKLDREAVGRRIADFTGGDPEEAARAAAGEIEIAPGILEEARLLKRELSGVAATFDAPTSMAATYSARRQSASGTPFEAELMTKMMQTYSGVDGMPFSDGLMEMASPLRGGHPGLRQHLFHMKETALGERGACILYEASAPMALTGLGDVLQEKFGAFDPEDSEDVQAARAERMRTYLARRAQYAVIVHEMGHSVGLRHNFVSSSDAYNYRPQYWQLRTRNGAVTDLCTDLQSDGADCVGPRYYDPVTEDERDGLLWMWMHSSVMDYAGELTQDMLGLGAYDFAAAKMFYGDAVAVYSDPTYLAGTSRGLGAVSKMDNFGGILGFQPTYATEDIHYSELQQRYDLISNCENVDPADFEPASWDTERDGIWHPIVDGLIVPVDGSYSRCRQQPVDHATWDSLRMPEGFEVDGWYRGGVSIDPKGRVRVPYGFATDRWADVGNGSVYRHDNGADTYEIFNFLITQQEVGHIFDNYRRNRQSFSVSGAANRTLYRYNTKLRDGAKGLGLLRNIYEDFATANGYAFDAWWQFLAPVFFPENILASGMVFDHMTRLLARPEDGDHFRPDGDTVLRSKNDSNGDGPTLVRVPNGATGYFGNVGIGGRPVGNALASNKGEYDSDFTINAGSYYDKVFTSMLMTESVDNFISDSRQDFVDARYRAVSLADLFPDGYRRWLANNLTADDWLKGPRLASSNSGAPLTDEDGYPTKPIGWTSWWGTDVRSCFPSEGTTVCSSYGNEEGEGFDPDTFSTVSVLDPQVGWEQQKFLIAWTLLYLPENQKLDWLDMIHIWELGPDSDPEIGNRIELHHPSGKVYIAKTYGRESIFGREVERGIAARVLEYANSLMVQAYVVDSGPDLNGDGIPDWWIPTLNEDTGQPMVKYDANLTHLANADQIWINGPEGCNAEDSSGCACTDNRACMALQDYVAIPAYMREAAAAYGLGPPGIKGIW